VEILSTLFPLDQKPKPSNQGLSLEQAFQQNVCAMAQKNQLCAIKITILDRDFGTLKIHTRKFYRMVVLGNIIRFIILQALKNI